MISDKRNETTFNHTDDIIGFVRSEVLKTHQIDLPEAVEKWIRTFAPLVGFVYHGAGVQDNGRIYINYKLDNSMNMAFFETTKDGKPLSPLKALNEVNRAINQINKDLDSLTATIPKLDGWCYIWCKLNDISTKVVIKAMQQPQTTFDLRGTEKVKILTFHQEPTPNANKQEVRLCVYDNSGLSDEEVSKITDHLEKWLSSSEWVSNIVLI